MNLNSVQLIGRIANDLEVRYTANETAVMNFTLANETGFSDKKQTNFLPVTIWGKVAENTANYCSKGSKVRIGGEVRQQNYNDKSGARQSKVYINAKEVEFLETFGKGKGMSSDSASDSIKDDDTPF
jgi:single-strand DNA-binding protein